MSGQVNSIALTAHRPLLGLPRLADIFIVLRHVSNVPKPEVAYSITSSARTSNEGRTDTPSALAVFMLISSSNLVGCSTGRSAGVGPLTIFSQDPPAWGSRSGIL